MSLGLFVISWFYHSWCTAPLPPSPLPPLYTSDREDEKQRERKAGREGETSEYCSTTCETSPVIIVTMFHQWFELGSLPWCVLYQTGYLLDPEDNINKVLFSLTEAWLWLLWWIDLENANNALRASLFCWIRGTISVKSLTLMFYL